MRDNLWLDLKLSEIWERHFADVSRSNEVEIKFGKRARTRLGSIRKSPKSGTLITITGFFKDEQVPKYIIDLTIAHELCHYAHGFFSPLPQLSKHPHQGGLVDSELIKRGFGDQLIAQKKWLKQKWPKVIGLNPIRRRRIRRRRYHPIGILKFLISN